MRVPLVLTGLISILLTTTACNSGALDRLRDYVPGVYTMDVHQGNIVSQAMVDQLRPGMNKRQVLFIMGTPLIEDPFHSTRWDYLYSNEPGGKDRVQKRISILFDDDELAGLQGDFHPEVVPAREPNQDVNVDIPKIDREKTLWESIKSLFTFGS